MVVNSRDDCIVMAIPCYHGNFGFEVAFLFTHCFSTVRQKKQKKHKLNLENILKYTKGSGSLLNTNEMSEITGSLYLKPSFPISFLLFPVEISISLLNPPLQHYPVYLCFLFQSPEEDSHLTKSQN